MPGLEISGTLSDSTEHYKPKHGKSGDLRSYKEAYRLTDISGDRVLAISLRLYSPNFVTITISNMKNKSISHYPR